MSESSKGVKSQSRLVVDGLSGLGQVAEDGVESVETLGAHDVGGSKDNDSL